MAVLNETPAEPLGRFDDSGRFIWSAWVSDVRKVYERHRTVNFQTLPCSKCGSICEHIYGDWWQCRDNGHWRRTITVIGSISRASYKFWRNR